MVDRAVDIELQIQKHLARDAHKTVAIIDEYCEEYKDLFHEVRNYECFKYLHLGIMSPIKRKSLPEIAKIVSIKSAQSLHHFIANSDWSVNKSTATSSESAPSSQPPRSGTTPLKGACTHMADSAPHSSTGTFVNCRTSH